MSRHTAAGGPFATRWLARLLRGLQAEYIEDAGVFEWSGDARFDRVQEAMIAADLLPAGLTWKRPALALSATDAAANRATILDACLSGEVRLPRGRFPVGNLVIAGRHIAALKRITNDGCTLFNGVDQLAPLYLQSNRFDYSTNLSLSTDAGAVLRGGFADPATLVPEPGDLVYWGKVDSLSGDRTTQQQVRRVVSADPEADTITVDSPPVLPGGLAGWERKSVKGRLVVGGLAAGSTAATLADPAAASLFSAGDLILVTDGFGIRELYAEPVQVLAVDGATVRFDRPVERDYQLGLAALMHGPHPTGLVIEEGLVLEPPVLDAPTAHHQAPYYVKGLVGFTWERPTVVLPAGAAPDATTASPCLVNCVDATVLDPHQPMCDVGHNSCWGVTVRGGLLRSTGGEEWNRYLTFVGVELLKGFQLAFLHDQPYTLMVDCTVRGRLVPGRKTAVVRTRLLDPEPGWDIYSNWDDCAYYDVVSEARLAARGRNTVVRGGSFPRVDLEATHPEYVALGNGPVSLDASGWAVTALAL